MEKIKCKRVTNISKKKGKVNIEKVDHTLYLQNVDGISKITGYPKEINDNYCIVHVGIEERMVDIPFIKMEDFIDKFKSKS